MYYGAHQYTSYSSKEILAVRRVAPNLAERSPTRQCLVCYEALSAEVEEDRCPTHTCEASLPTGVC
ncbi:hypothetical protein WG66_002485 [Moniliophthora roreri]|nr:hypothetical protein WG66_002485 [Moniliophthora roreri]